jgi:hypothetical protein
MMCLCYSYSAICGVLSQRFPSYCDTIPAPYPYGPYVYCTGTVVVVCGIVLIV